MNFERAPRLSAITAANMTVEVYPSIAPSHETGSSSIEKGHWALKCFRSNNTSLKRMLKIEKQKCSFQTAQLLEHALFPNPAGQMSICTEVRHEGEVLFPDTAKKMHQGGVTDANAFCLLS